MFVKEEDVFNNEQAPPFDDSLSPVTSEDSDLIFLGYTAQGPLERDDFDGVDTQLRDDIAQAKRLSLSATEAPSQDQGTTRALDEVAGEGLTLRSSSSLSPPHASSTSSTLSRFNGQQQRSSRAQDDAWMKRNQDKVNAKNTRFWNKSVKTFQIGEIVTVIANPNNPRRPSKIDQRRVLGRIAALDPSDKYRYVVHCRWGRIQGSFLSEALNSSEGLDDPTQDIHYDPSMLISLKEAVTLEHPGNEKQQPEQQRQQKTSISTQSFRTHNVNSTPKKFKLRSALTHKRGRSSGSNAAIAPPTSKRARHVTFPSPLPQRRTGLRTSAEKRKTTKAREAEAEVEEEEEEEEES